MGNLPLLRRASAAGHTDGARRYAQRQLASQSAELLRRTNGRRTSMARLVSRAQHSLCQKRCGKFSGIKRSEIVDIFSNTNIPYRHVELLGDIDDDAPFGSPVQLG